METTENVIYCLICQDKLEQASNKIVCTACFNFTCKTCVTNSTTTNCPACRTPYATVTSVTIERPLPQPQSNVAFPIEVSEISNVVRAASRLRSQQNNLANRIAQRQRETELEQDLAAAIRNSLLTYQLEQGEHPLPLTPLDVSRGRGVAPPNPPTCHTGDTGNTGDTGDTGGATFSLNARPTIDGQNLSLNPTRNRSNLAIEIQTSVNGGWPPRTTATTCGITGLRFPFNNLTQRQTRTRSNNLAAGVRNGRSFSQLRQSRPSHYPVNASTDSTPPPIAPPSDVRIYRRGGAGGAGRATLPLTTLLEGTGATTLPLPIATAQSERQIGETGVTTSEICQRKTPVNLKFARTGPSSPFAINRDSTLSNHVSSQLVESHQTPTTGETIESDSVMAANPIAGSLSPMAVDTSTSETASETSAKPLTAQPVRPAKSIYRVPRPRYQTVTMPIRGGATP